MADRPRDPGASTRAVHAGERERQQSSAVTTPIHQTSTFWFRDSAELPVKCNNSCYFVPIYFCSW